MNYKIIFRERAKRVLNSLPAKDSKRIFETIVQLGINPYPRGCKKLKGRAGYRVKQDNYRVVYEVNKQEICILSLTIGHRKNIY